MTEAHTPVAMAQSPGPFLPSPVSPPHHCTGIDFLVEPCVIQAKVNANAVKQEHEKQKELKRSSFRAAAAPLTIPDSSERSRGRGRGRGRQRGEWRGEGRDGRTRRWTVRGVVEGGAVS